MEIHLDISFALLCIARRLDLAEHPGTGRLRFAPPGNGNPLELSRFNEDCCESILMATVANFQL